MRRWRSLRKENLTSDFLIAEVAPIVWTLGLGSRSFSMMLLESIGTRVAERGVSPLTVVKQLDVFEHGATVLGVGAPPTAVHQLDFEGGKEAFRHRIVPAVAAAAHAAHDAVLG
jgi:hypothetical protein